MTEIESGIFEENLMYWLMEDIERRHGHFEMAIPKDGDVTITHWWLVKILEKGAEKQVLVFGTPETYALFKKDVVQ